MAKKRAVTKAKLDRVALIVRGDSVDQNQNQDEGELHTGGLARLFGYKKVEEKTLEDLKADIAKLSDTVSVIANAIQTKQATDFRVTTIEIGVAISAEGSIGIATAGVEASITVTLERK